MKNFKLDGANITILMMIQKDAMVTAKEISRRCFLSPSAVYTRLQKMKKLGIILGRVAILRKKEIGTHVVVFVTARLINYTEIFLASFRTAIAVIPEIKECNLTDSNNRTIMKVVVKDMEVYHQFYYEKLLSIPGLTDILSSFAIAEKKCETVIKL